LSSKYLVWDCASTHGAVRITSARKKSFWHSYAAKAGMKGVIFLPPRTPILNPIELVFGFLKHQVRKQCPDEGYTPTGLIQAIHHAFRLVTPAMI
jgi:transposase